MTRPFALARWKSHPKETRLAPLYLAEGRRSLMPPAPQDQRVRSDAIILGSTLGSSEPSHVADAEPLSLVMERLRRMNNNQQLQHILNQARQLQDPRKRQYVFFEVARCYVRKNGSHVDLNGILQFAVSTNEPGTATISRSADSLDQHHIRFSFQRRVLGKSKILVAIGGGFVFEAREAIRDSEWSKGVDNDSGKTMTGAAHETLANVLLLSITKKIREDAWREKSQKIGGRTVVTHELDLDLLVPEEIDYELLVWDRVLSFEVNTRTLDIRTIWMGKLGESRLPRFGWDVIPLPYLLEF